MSLSAAEIEAVVADLAPWLEGGKICRIDQPERHKVILHILSRRKRYWLQFVAHPRFSRLHLLTRRPEQGKPAGGFCNVLRQHITPSQIEKLSHVEGDRVVILEVTRRDALFRPSRMRLVAELMGPGSNLILLDESDKALGALSSEDSPRRKVFPGAPYQAIPRPASLPARALRNRFADAAASTEDELALSRAVHDAYHGMEMQAELDERRARLRSLVRGRVKAMRSRRETLAREWERSQGADGLRRCGELLKIALPTVQKGDRRVVVQDFFEPNAPEVTVELDPTIGPEQNAERYFKRYKKLKAARERLAERIRKADEELARLDELAPGVDAAADLHALEEMEERVRAEGIVLAQERRGPERKRVAAGPRVFQSIDGLEILVARSQRENHELTFSIARGNDYWMHILGREGPHVVIRRPRGKDVPLETLLDAAHLAIHYSKARGTDYAEVVYTQRKYVRPVRGGSPGAVTYADVSRLAVHVDEGRARRLLDARGP